jgi:hypothetical protein
MSAAAKKERLKVAPMVASLANTTVEGMGARTVAKKEN